MTYPENISITELKCEVPLQDLIDHTTKRLVLHLGLNFTNNEKLKLTFKYGMDGTNAKCFKQKSENPAAFCDSVFSISLLPLQLEMKNTESILWKNPRPSSTRFCRPIKISFEKETDELCKAEEQNLLQQISQLKDVEVAGCSISAVMILTMIDGKVIQFIYLV